LQKEPHPKCNLATDGETSLMRNTYFESPV
jgi:hypothetical protein